MAKIQLTLSEAKKHMTDKQFKEYIHGYSKYLGVCDKSQHFVIEATYASSALKRVMKKLPKESAAYKDLDEKRKELANYIKGCGCPAD